MKAAADAKTDPAFVVMARTDALAVEGLQAAVDRACACVEAGADPQSIARTHYDSNSLSRVRIFGAVMNGMVIVDEGRVALLSITRKTMAERLPEFNFFHVPLRVLPALRERGVTEEQIRQMVVGNPRRIFEQQGAY